MDLYLDVAEARDRLLAMGVFSEETAPDSVRLEELLLRVQSRLELWLGYSPLPNDYRERRMSNGKGLIRLNFYPVINVTEMETLAGRILGKPFNVRESLALWRGRTTLDVGMPNILVEVSYRAGFDPLPEVFEQVLLDLLAESLDGGVAGLEEPTKDVTSLSVPGGLSQSFKLGETQPGSRFERICAPLERYRKKMEF